jgi:hypothetical protein
MEGMGRCTKQFRGIRGGAICLGKTAAAESRKVFFMKSLQSLQSRHATRVEAYDLRRGMVGQIRGSERKCLYKQVDEFGVVL